MPIQAIEDSGLDDQPSDAMQIFDKDENRPKSSAFSMDRRRTGSVDDVRQDRGVPVHAFKWPLTRPNRSGWYPPKGASGRNGHETWKPGAGKVQIRYSYDFLSS